MSSDLRTWTQSRLSALYSAHADDTFASAYAQAFAPDVKMAFADAPQGDATGQSQVVAGEGTREERMEGEEARKALEARAKGGAQASTAQVEFGEMNVEPGADELTGTASGVFTVTRNLKFRIRAAPAQVLTTVHFKATISPDAVDASDAEDGDTRRITEYAQTSETHRPPIVLPHLPVQPRKTEDL